MPYCFVFGIADKDIPEIAQVLAGLSLTEYPGPLGRKIESFPTASLPDQVFSFRVKWVLDFRQIFAGAVTETDPVPGKTDTCPATIAQVISYHIAQFTGLFHNNRIA